VKKRVRENEHEGLSVHESGGEPCSGDAKTERCGKGIWYPEEPDRDLWSGFRTSIACQALSPGETPVCALCTGKQSNRRRLNGWGCFSELDINALVTKEFHQFSPMKAPLPVSPHNGMRSGKWRWESNDLLGCVEWPEHRTDAARFPGSRPITLTFLTPRAGTAMTDAGGIDHAHTAVSFGAMLLGIQEETSRTL
jgi:hypothetical protein